MRDNIVATILLKSLVFFSFLLSSSDIFGKGIVGKATGITMLTTWLPSVEEIRVHQVRLWLNPMLVDANQKWNWVSTSEFSAPFAPKQLCPGISFLTVFVPLENSETIKHAKLIFLFQQLRISAAFQYRLPISIFEDGNAVCWFKPNRWSSDKTIWSPILNNIILFLCNNNRSAHCIPTHPPVHSLPSKPPSHVVSILKSWMQITAVSFLTRLVHRAIQGPCSL